MHANEVDTSEGVVRALLRDQRPEWAQLPINHARTSGSSNAIWWLHRAAKCDLVVRRPRMPRAAVGWAVLDRGGRQAFRDALEVDEATWLRARVNTLEQAVGAVLFYRPRGHMLADVMQRTLDRILEG